MVPGRERAQPRRTSARSLDAGGHDDDTQLLLADAQTSGGLLFGATDAGAATAAVAQLTSSGHTAAVVGRVTAPGEGRIALR